MARSAELFKQRIPHQRGQSTEPRRLVRRSRPLWYAVSVPGLLSLPEAEAHLRLRQLAESARVLSDKISLSSPEGFVFEIRSSLRYFGGVNAIRLQLQTLLEKQLHAWDIALTFFQSVTPTATASLLLARSGANALVYQADSLRSALGRLPTASLALPARQKKQLQQSGLFYLRDLWRLPGAAVRQRFGNELADYLALCLGQKKEKLALCAPLPAFQAHVEIEHAMEYVDRLIPLVQELCAQLCDYLQRNGLCTAHLLLQLHHENHAAEIIEMDLRRPSRSDVHIMLLLENRLASLNLTAPVNALTLETRFFDRFHVNTNNLFGIQEEGQDYKDQLQTLLEQLQSRLGNKAVQLVQLAEAHCPERASYPLCYGEPLPRISNQSVSYVINMTGSRPYWLLDEPESLLEKHGTLYHVTPLFNSRLVITSGVERIETSWWEGPDIRRDYYVAADDEGHRYWIYHSRSKPSGWYLHGIF